MKPKILKLSLFCLVFALMGASCQDDEEFSEIVEGYIVGSFICDETDGENGQATGNNTERGFCILIKDSENTNETWPMDMYTFNIPIDLFDFPDEILESTYSNLNCGPSFFSENLKTTYKIEFEYRIVGTSNKVNFTCGPCSAVDQSFKWDSFEQVVLKNINIKE